MDIHDIIRREIDLLLPDPSTIRPRRLLDDSTLDEALEPASEDLEATDDAGFLDSSLHHKESDQTDDNAASTSPRTKTQHPSLPGDFVPPSSDAEPTRTQTPPAPAGTTTKCSWWLPSFLFG